MKEQIKKEIFEMIDHKKSEDPSREEDKTTTNNSENATEEKEKLLTNKYKSHVTTGQKGKKMK